MSKFTHTKTLMMNLLLSTLCRAFEFVFVFVVIMHVLSVVKTLDTEMQRTNLLSLLDDSQKCLLHENKYDPFQFNTDYYSLKYDPYWGFQQVRVHGSSD